MFTTRLYGLLLLLAGLCIASPVTAKPWGSAYKDGGDSEYALILCHGRGKHPTWKVVNPLRKGVNKELGWHTLSLQMPADNKSWREYEDDFPKAFDKIRDGIKFLMEKKGVKKVYLMGHSMGSRMVSAYVAYNADHGVDGLIVAGLRNNGGGYLDGQSNLSQINLVPILDIYGGDDMKDDDAATERADMVSERYQQVAISDANHKFDGYDSELVDAVVAWLRSTSGD